MSLETIVQGRIGAINFGSVYAVQAPEGSSFPVVVWQRISAAPVDTHDNAPTDAFISRVQIDCYADNIETARSLMEEVISAMEGTPDESAIQCAGKMESYEQDAQVYRASADFFVWANN